MSTEGSIRIELRTRGGGVEAVAIHSTRPVLAAKIFNGRKVSHVLRLLPLLFMVCGSAQAAACVRACEQALGLAPTPAADRLRDRLVNMETVREHLGRVLLDWPVLLGGQSDTANMARVMELARQYKDGLSAAADPFTTTPVVTPGDHERVAAAADGIVDILEHAVFGIPAERWLEFEDPQDLFRWAANGRTASTRLVDEVIRREWAASGRCAVGGLPSIDAARLQTTIDDEFVARPQWLGECRETSCFTRTDSGLLRRLRVEHGNGVLPRIAARLTEIARLAGEVSRFSPESPDGPPDRYSAVARPANPGIGQAAAARGMLVHRARLADETVLDYHILAPTEWNFHPNGVVAAGLAGLHGDREALEFQARLLISSIDPCVAFELRIA